MANTYHDRVLVSGMGSVLQKTDRILTSDPMVTVNAHLQDDRAFSTGNAITLGFADLSLSKSEDVVVAMGRNYHELAHVMFTPRGHASAFHFEDENGEFKYFTSAFNYLEESRIETLFSAKFGKSKFYFTVMFSRIAMGLADDHAGGVSPEEKDARAALSLHLLAHGRGYLPTELRTAIRDRAFAAFPDDADAERIMAGERIIDAYRVMTSRVLADKSDTYPGGKRGGKKMSRMTLAISRFHNLFPELFDSLNNDPQEAPGACSSKQAQSAPSPYGTPEKGQQQTPEQKEKNEEQEEEASSRARQDQKDDYEELTLPEDEDDQENDQDDDDQESDQEDRDQEDRDQDEDEGPGAGGDSGDDDGETDQEDSDDDGEGSGDGETGEDTSDAPGGSGGSGDPSTDDDDQDDDGEPGDEGSGGGSGDRGSDSGEDDDQDDDDDSGAGGAGGESDDEGSANGAGHGLGAPTPTKEDTEDILESVIESVIRNSAVAQEVDRISQDFANAGEQSSDYWVKYSREETATERDAIRDTGAVFDRLQDRVAPGWVYGSDSGRLNVGRVMTGADPEDMFDSWDEGHEDDASVEIVFLLDMSGSMGMNNRMTSASSLLHTLRKSVQSLTDSHVSVYGFNDDTIVPVLKGRNDDTVDAEVPVYSCSGGTSVHEALTRARDVFAQSDARNRILFVLTDGVWSNRDMSGYFAGNVYSPDQEYRDLLRDISARKVLCFIDRAAATVNPLWAGFVDELTELFDSSFDCHRAEDLAGPLLGIVESVVAETVS